MLKFDDEKVPLWNLSHKLKTLRKIKVESIRLDTFIEKHNIKKIDFLKIDAQGADLDVLRSRGKKLSIVKKLQVEVCDIMIYEGGNNYNDTVSYLNSHGFTKTKTIQHNQFKDVIFKNENY